MCVIEGGGGPSSLDPGFKAPPWSQTKALNPTKEEKACFQLETLLFGTCFQLDFQFATSESLLCLPLQYTSEGLEPGTSRGAGAGNVRYGFHTSSSDWVTRRGLNHNVMVYPVPVMYATSLYF